ncbi:hypothetical protein SAMN05421640_1379 [Ekhidna lutea]|uniref:Uncharacterized protein n=1 Tax=Ekhidna lutea TaxID=447679 RepID=A0A239HLB6_EKHLU|nr:hypothetical protein [Ekhidna lutea]SNS82130.1 hypothetical protein SAMN05421640_1379 [Ekhidna lutea]
MMLKLGYIGLTIAVCVLLIHFGFIAINKSFEASKRKSKKNQLIAGVVLWQIYLVLVGSWDFIQSYSFPPRFALMMIIPAFIFTGVFVYRNRNEVWIQHLPTKSIFYFQSFRILVESLFVASVAAGILHKEASIEGYNYDMVYAITVPIVGLIAFNGKSPNLKLVRFWNYLGLIILATVIFVFMTSVYKPDLYGANEPLLPFAAMTYPYVLVAGSLMPIAVFMHVLSIAHLNKLIGKK